MRDEDLQAMSRERLIEEVKRLRNGIREHRDSQLHDLCWPEFMRGCIKYRQSLDKE